MKQILSSPIFCKHLIKLGGGYQKENRIDGFVFETLDPFSSLRSLSTDVDKHKRYRLRNINNINMHII